MVVEPGLVVHPRLEGDFDGSSHHDHLLREVSERGLDVLKALISALSSFAHLAAEFVKFPAHVAAEFVRCAPVDERLTTARLA